MNTEQRNLILNWIDDSRALLHVHCSIAESLRGKHRKLGIPAAILSAVVGTSVFATIGKDPSIYTQVAVGLTSIAASVLSTLTAFLNYLEVAIKHQQTGAGFAAIRKELEQLLAFPPEKDSDLKGRIADIRVRWDKLRQEAIPVSTEKVKAYQNMIDKSRMPTNQSSDTTDAGS